VDAQAPAEQVGSEISLPAAVTSTDFWEGAFRRERTQKLELVRKVHELTKMVHELTKVRRVIDRVYLFTI
jgi:hypothetical protein